ncbi:hypothetical protein GCM10023315_08790 [Algibacter aquimarinus]|uniref:Uncharacterized protein n=1 Tax=Algibacter aquimarinus TaxID=1136748 RepID=A0ABP9H755_9FLAO
MVGKSFLDLSLIFNFLNLQNRNKKMAAKALLNHIIKGVGRSIYFPNTPDVLMNNVARPNSKR